MGRLLVACMLGVSATAALAGEPRLGRFEFARTKMAVPMKVVLYALDSVTATEAAEAAYARIDRLNAILSDYDPQSELRRLSDATSEGKPVPVSRDLWQVLTRAQALAEQSDGAFDVTIGPVVRLWRRARRRGQLPSPERLRPAMDLVGYRFVRLDVDSRTVQLLKPEMRLDLGGIAKGYAADQAIGVLRKFSANRAMIDAGGDIVLADPPPGKTGWRIALAPLEPRGPPSKVLLLANVAVATSGDAWQYVEIAGRRYSHIVDPRTGLGLTDHSSVTVVAPDGVTADGLASAVSILGPQKGLKLIEATPGAAAYIIRAPHGKVETYRSNRWKKL